MSQCFAYDCVFSESGLEQMSPALCQILLFSAFIFKYIMLFECYLGGQYILILDFVELEQSWDEPLDELCWMLPFLCFMLLWQGVLLLLLLADGIVLWFSFFAVALS